MKREINLIMHGSVPYMKKKGIKKQWFSINERKFGTHGFSLNHIPS